MEGQVENIEEAKGKFPFNGNHPVIDRFRKFNCMNVEISDGNKAGSLELLIEADVTQQ